MASIEEEIQQKKFTNEFLKANINILFTANWLNNKLAVYFKAFNLSNEQFNVLRILRGKHPAQMCQKDILARMIARQSNLTMILKKLVQKGLVNIARSETDGRAYLISITEAGLGTLEKLDIAMEPLQNSFNPLTISEAFHLNALLDKLRSSEDEL